MSSSTSTSPPTAVPGTSAVPVAAAPRRRPVIVVGAGPAGLAVAAELARRGVVATLLEAGDRAGSAWRRHDPWLRLHTTRRDSALPGLPLPASAGRYPTRDEFADYLERYAAALEGELCLGRTVRHVAPDGARGWRLVVEGGNDGVGENKGEAEEMAARHVVVAAGFNRRAVRPRLPGEDRFAGPVAHASRWRAVVGELGGEVDTAGHPRGLAGRRLLVAGLGNTGADLVAALVAAGAEVAVAVRGPVHLVPLEILGVSWRTWYRLAPGALSALGRLGGGRGRRVAARAAAAAWCRLARRRFGDLEGHGLALQRPDQLVAHWAAARPPLTEGPFVDLIRRREVPVLPELVGFAPGVARLAGGGGQRGDVEHRCDAVLLATGFRPALDELLPASLRPWPPFDGRPGRLPGLWLCGYQPELLRIRRAARRVARGIAADLG